jgi:outer membrane receptor protein involved in Fe transport
LYTDRLAKGWEFELRANLNQNLAIIGSYTKFTNRDPNNVEFRGVAESAGSLLVSYEFGQESAQRLDGFRIAVGVDYLGKRPGDTPIAAYTIASTPTNLIPNRPSFYLDARTLVNLTLAYDSKRHWGAQVNVDNLLNEEYLMASNIRNGVFTGTPTNVRVSLRYGF